MVCLGKGNRWCMYYSLPRGGHGFLQKYRDRNAGGVSAVLFRTLYRGQGSI